MKNRMWNFFREDGRSIILAIDHANGGRCSFGDPENIFRVCAAAGADGVLTTYGMIKKYRGSMGHMGVIMRMDQRGTVLNQTSNVPAARYCVEDAIRLGVDGIMSGVYYGYEKDGINFDTASMEMFTGIVSACDKWNLALCAEVLPKASVNPADFTLEEMKIGCRAVAEAGADFIKTVYLDGFADITANTYIPILALGGSYLENARDVFAYIANALAAGCKGLVIGRNVWNNENIDGYMRAMVAMVHEDASIDDALAIVGK